MGQDMFFVFFLLIIAGFLIYYEFFSDNIALKSQERKRKIEEDNKKREDEISREKLKTEEEIFNRRMLNYKTIIYDFKLQVASRYQANFLNEAEMLIGDAKKDSPASWIDYEILKGWCAKYVKAYPNEDGYKKQNTNHDNESEILKNKFVEREQFQKERLKNNK
jgi:hypothetical protein